MIRTCHDERPARHRPALEREDQSDEREHDDVARRHVREQTHRERERLGELSEQLDRRHDQNIGMRMRSGSSLFQ
jgi:hypothetical protein